MTLNKNYMKKLLLFFCLTVISVQTMHAQTVQESLNLDSWYVGLNAGTIMPASTFKFNEANAGVGVRVGRWFTPVVGLLGEGQAFFGQNGQLSASNAAINVLALQVMGTLNFSNWFYGYPGKPRDFEVMALAGMGMGHFYKPSFDNPINGPNNMTSKFALDFVYNFGSDKQWQAYAEPGLMYQLANGYTEVKYNFQRCLFSFNVGLNYKFLNSNGTHNFKIVDVCDPNEIASLNDKINQLRQEGEDKDALLASKDELLANKDAEIADLKKALEECDTVKIIESSTSTNLQPTVLFRKGKSVIDPAQYAPIELIALYMRNHPEAKIEIRGYSSPEGATDLNQRLSERRAAAVKDALVNKYKINSNRLSTIGCGETDKLFEQVEFNRVATFNDTSK
jgi:outer membrane protein OmpA-like peptidoglycan-associated protein